MSGVAERKQALRAEHRRLRRALPATNRQREAAAAAELCLMLVRRLAPPAVASYLAMPDELDLEPLHQALWRIGMTVFLPRVAAPGALSWHPLRSAMDAVRGTHGIREPDPAVAPAAPLPAGTLVFVPGLAFAADGRRLGQGGGYYDRFLPAAGAVEVGVGFACQRCDDLPVDAHDHPLAGLVLAGELVRDPATRLQP